MTVPDVLWATATPPERQVDGVEFATTAGEAVGSIRAAAESGRRYAAVVTDYELPDEPCWAVVERARSTWPDVAAFLRADGGRVETNRRPFCEHLPSTWTFDRALSAVGSAVASRRQRSYPVPAGEDARLAALTSIETSRLPGDERMVTLAAEFGVDAVAVTVVADHTTTFVSSNDPALANLEKERCDTACTYTVANDEATRIPDIREDPRFARSAPDADSYRCYLGVPIRIGGTPVGALCAFAESPDSIEANVRPALREHAASVERSLVD